MTTHTVPFYYATGQTLTAKLFTSADVLEDEASSVVENTNRKQRYVATFEDVAAGDYLMVYYIAGSAAGYEEVRFTGVDLEVGVLLPGQYIPTVDQLNARTLVAADYATSAVQGTEAAKTTSILADTNELQSDWADGGRLDLIIDSRASQVSVNSLNNISSAQVNAELLDVLSVDTFAELASPPAASSSLKDKITWLFMWLRNKSTESATQRKLYADDTTTVVSTEAISDAAGTFTKGEQV